MILGVKFLSSSPIQKSFAESGVTSRFLFVQNGSGLFGDIRFVHSLEADKARILSDR